MERHRWLFTLVAAHENQTVAGLDGNPPRGRRESERSISGNLRALDEHLSNADVRFYDLRAS